VAVTHVEYTREPDGTATEYELEHLQTPAASYRLVYDFDCE
jgi:hypothetical protein